MSPLDYACSYYSVPTDFACKAQPGEMCNWPDGNGGRRSDSRCHADRMEAFAAMVAASGAVPDAGDFDAAVDRALSGAAGPPSKSV